MRSPARPGNGGQGQNQDGFYRLLATDDVWPDDELDIFVKDDREQRRSSARSPRRPT